jgi:hypothetical protein
LPMGQPHFVIMALVVDLSRSVMTGMRFPCRIVIARPIHVDVPFGAAANCEHRKHVTAVVDCYRERLSLMLS